MTDTGTSSFVYVTYIKATPERLWDALVSPELIPRYWMGIRPEAEWRLGGAWRILFPDGRVADSGEITGFDPPTRLALRWRNQWSPDLHAEGWSLCTMELEPAGEGVKLTITHSLERAHSKFIEGVAGGWPKILSNLKSLLETGAVVLPAKAA